MAGGSGWATIKTTAEVATKITDELFINHPKEAYKKTLERAKTDKDKLSDYLGKYKDLKSRLVNGNFWEGEEKESYIQTIDLEIKNVQADMDFADNIINTYQKVVDQLEDSSVTKEAVKLAGDALHKIGIT